MFEGRSARASHERRKSPFVFACGILALAASLGAACPARAGSEIAPGSFSPLPAGTQVLSFSQYQRQFDAYYFDGQRRGDAEVVGRASVIGYARYGETAGLASAWSVALPWVEAHKTGGVLPVWFGDRTRGFSDLRLRYSLWLPTPPAEGRYLALSGVWQPATGRYTHRQVLNPGDNRNRLTLQLAWTEPLSREFTLELVPEASFHGDNRDYYAGRRMEQERAWGLTGWLRWRFAPGWEGSGGFQNNGGGDQIIDGLRRHNEPDQRRLMFSLGTGLAPDLYASLRYTRDTAARNSLKIASDWVLNLNWLF